MDGAEKAMFTVVAGWPITNGVYDLISRQQELMVIVDNSGQEWLVF